MTKILKIANEENPLEEICRENIVGAKLVGNYISVPQPNSIKEAENLASFWYPIFEKKKYDVKIVDFVYQEKNKKLPLSYGKKFLKKLGIKIKHAIKEGEIKRASLNPELTRYYDKQTVKFILNEDEWISVNKLAQNSDTFNAPFAMLPKNLCYQVNIPLECITRIEVKEKN